MKTNAALLLLLAITFSCCLAGPRKPAIRRLAPQTLQETVQLALKHNHDIRIAGYMGQPLC
jgi:hypothetical protein